MAKSTRSKAEDTPTTGAARPGTGQRRTGRQSRPADGEPASGPATSSESTIQFGRQDLASPETQDFISAPEIERYESIPSEPSEQEIRLRAYLLYLDRGALDGADFDDWIQAETELRRGRRNL